MNGIFIKINFTKIYLIENLKFFFNGFYIYGFLPIYAFCLLLKVIKVICMYLLFLLPPAGTALKSFRAGVPAFQAY